MPSTHTHSLSCFPHCCAGPQKPLLSAVHEEGEESLHLGGGEGVGSPSADASSAFDGMFKQSDAKSR
jgi:hypothetical protein